MAFELPVYCEPNFEEERFKNAPDARVECAPMDGVAPDGYHSTSMYPEYFKLNGAWRLAEESRMDSSVVVRENGRLDVVENRNLKAGDRVILGRSENGEEGIFVHAHGFDKPGEARDQFAFRQGRSRAEILPAHFGLHRSFCSVQQNRRFVYSYAGESGSACNSAPSARSSGADGVLPHRTFPVCGKATEGAAAGFRPPQPAAPVLSTKNGAVQFQNSVTDAGNGGLQGP